MGGERLIVVDVGMPLATEDQLNSPFSIANQMLGAMMKKLTDEQLRTLGAHDVLISLVTFGNRHFAPEGESVLVVDAATGARAEPILVDRRSGRPLTPGEYRLAPAPATLARLTGLVR